MYRKTRNYYKTENVTWKIKEKLKIFIKNLGKFKKS